MKEHQNVEWKESWRDEYLKWICGFANAEGGVLVIGRNDKGAVVGVADARKLLQDLPNKIRDVLGIMADVNLVKKSGKELIEIRVEPYPTPISYKGEYHYRSGSTKQELKGAALDQFLLRKQGRTWDGAPWPGVTVRDLSKPAIDTFRKAARQSGRVEPAVLRESASGLIEKLHLVEGKYLMIWNPGYLPPSWTVAKLTGKHSSQPPNPDIANVFFRAGEIEAWGWGIDRMLIACHDAGCPKPLFEYEQPGLWVTFPFSPEVVALTGGDGAEKVGEKTRDKTREKTREKLLRTIRGNPQVTSDELAQACGITRKGVEWQINKLKKEGVLTRVGADRGGHWEILP
jgi:predicted HTH transcriptional regulator